MLGIHSLGCLEKMLKKISGRDQTVIMTPPLRRGGVRICMTVIGVAPLNTEAKKCWKSTFSKSLKNDYLENPSGQNRDIDQIDTF